MLRTPWPIDFPSSARLALNVSILVVLTVGCTQDKLVEDLDSSTERRLKDGEEVKESEIVPDEESTNKGTPPDQSPRKGSKRRGTAHRSVRFTVCSTTTYDSRDRKSVPVTVSRSQLSTHVGFRSSFGTQPPLYTSCYSLPKNRTPGVSLRQLVSQPLDPEPGKGSSEQEDLSCAQSLQFPNPTSGKWLRLDLFELAPAHWQSLQQWVASQLWDVSERGQGRYLYWSQQCGEQHLQRWLQFSDPESKHTYLIDLQTLPLNIFEELQQKYSELVWSTAFQPKKESDMPATPHSQMGQPEQAEQPTVSRWKRWKERWRKTFPKRVGRARHPGSKKKKAENRTSAKSTFYQGLARLVGFLGHLAGG